MIVPRFGHVDMDEENLAKVISACKSACGAEHKYYKDFAVQIKAELDREIGPSWHIVVGKLQKYSNAEIRHTFWLIRWIRA